MNRIETCQFIQVDFIDNVRSAPQERFAYLLLSGTIRGNFFRTAVSSCIMVSMCSVLRCKKVQLSGLLSGNNRAAKEKK